VKVERIAWFPGAVTVAMEVVKGIVALSQWWRRSKMAQFPWSAVKAGWTARLPGVATA
jgi:hypothetical protein